MEYFKVYREENNSLTIIKARNLETAKQIYDNEFEDRWYKIKRIGVEEVVYYVTMKELLNHTRETEGQLSFAEQQEIYNRVIDKVNRYDGKNEILISINFLSININ